MLFSTFNLLVLLHFTFAKVIMLYLVLILVTISFFITNLVTFLTVTPKIEALSY